ncbi:MAG: M1 family metallopeptidase, partial [Alphaproteobacteria bacterium]|nr:M1 family metallopeptidase [Alphaproteobacteria bacterium]
MGRAKSVVLAALGAASVALAAQAQSVRPQMLPDDVVPRHYDLALVPDAKALTFKATVTIDVTVARPVKDVLLNADGLTFDSVSADGARTKAAATPTQDTKLNRATLHFAQPLAAGAHTIAIRYHGTIGHETLGFFAMDYNTAQGSRRTLATNFEPAAARKLLPCWDEPARKATFTVSVVAPKDEVAVSNMPVAKSEGISAAQKRVTFATTPKMSTYLLFVSIGDYERVHQAVDGTDVGVVVKRGDTAKAAYALEQASALLHFYNGYFGVRFPLPKLDLVAAPGQIEGGSMENWGAIFYSQQHLLFDPARSTEADRQLVFLVVSHEMAHQWFGDLVTMRWWDNLWLNEGFARWMQTYAADALHPQWETGLKAQSIFEQGKEEDALPSTHPVLQPVITAEQAGEAFDAITYNKGAAVITMLNAYIGKAKFEEGVQRYMRAHAYGNTVDTDLWSIMQQVAGKPILKIERDFTRQEGLPLVRLATGKGVTLSEDRVFADGNPVKAKPAQHWTIPLPVAAFGTPAQSILLSNTAAVPQAPALLVNAGQTAYARVLYPDAAFGALSEKIASLAAVDQIGLMNDARALGYAGYAPASRTLAVMSRIPANADPIVWQRAVAILRDLDMHYGERPKRAAFRAFARALLRPVANRLGPAPKTGKAAGDAVLRGQAIEALGRFGDTDVIARAKKMVADGSGSAAEQRAALLIAGMKATPAEFDALLARARKTDDPLIKSHLYQALAGVEDPALAGHVIALALGDEMAAGTNISALAQLSGSHP